MKSSIKEAAATLFLLLGFILLFLGASSFGRDCPQIDLNLCKTQIGMIVVSVVMIYFSIKYLS